jgi:putative toxin-antitoxin system antitoxin component (TIGR02293 family)
MNSLSRKPESTKANKVAVIPQTGSRRSTSSASIARLNTERGVYVGAVGHIGPDAVIERSKKGLLISKLESVQAKSPFSESQWAAILDMTLRTLQRQKQKGETLDTARSERVILIEQMLQYGLEVFNDSEAFGSWLQSPSWPLNGKRPLDLLDTATGIQLVHAAIGRIDYGVFA